ncbi:MarR family transcriptional regulator [Streptomyces lasiicapitis]|uniref:MarR family transcriptional regulator n=1 Tax=Streptomyces lasiicapitis TaxID=1923961 RepID=UPI00331DB90F
MTKDTGGSPRAAGGQETEVWGYKEVGEAIGVQAGTVRYYWSQKRHLLPAPDVVLSGKPGWYPATVEAWKSKRPGQGFRTDLQDTAD